MNFKEVNAINLVTHKVDTLLEQAKISGHHDKTSFRQKDAWNLKIFAEFDLITLNSLNMYEPEIKRVMALYKEKNFIKL